MFLVNMFNTLYNRYIFFPLGISSGLRPIKPWKGQAPDNPMLEKVYLTSRKGKITYKQIQGLAKQLDWSERQVERWIRMRKMQDRPSKLVKFVESSWRFSYYFFAFSYGVWTLWDKPWLWDINECWYTFPHQVIVKQRMFPSVSQNDWLIIIFSGNHLRYVVVLYDFPQLLLVIPLYLAC